MAAYTCPLCLVKPNNGTRPIANKYHEGKVTSSSTTLKLYVSHLRVVHAKDPKFSIICGVAGCREVFRAFSA